MTRCTRNCLFGLVVASVILTSRVQALSQQNPPSITPAKKLKDGWEEIDDRLIFLMIRLANTETSLDAAEKELGINTREEKSSLNNAKRAEQNNEMMDRKGGGPVRWSEFYGRTAEKFFYHPVDQSTSYHTITILTPQHNTSEQKLGNVAGSQSVPLSQRPPQFDYIYRANQEAKTRAEKEASDLRSKRDELAARRKSLEEEQSALWCEIAFHAVSHYDLDRKPLYRFEPLLTSDADIATKQHVEVMKAAINFMHSALAVISEAQKDQATAFDNVKLIVSDGRVKLGDAWLRQGIETTDHTTPEARFAALAKRLEDLADNLSDSYKVSIDGDRFKDEVRKNTFRGQLQESLVNYAEVVLALDEMSVAMARQWNIKPDIEKPLPVSVATAVAKNDTQFASSIEPSIVPKVVVPLEGNLLKNLDVGKSRISGDWVLERGELVSGLNNGDQSLFEIPATLGDKYKVTALVRREKGNNALAFFLSSGGRDFIVQLDGWDKGHQCSGISYIDGATHTDPRKPNGTRTDTTVFGNEKTVRIDITVKPENIVAEADGRVICQWSGNFSHLTNPEIVQRGIRSGNFYITTHKTSYRFSVLSISDIK